MPAPGGGGGYGAERGQAYLNHVQTAIDKFAASYSPNRPTLILFPGGLGSKLLRDDNANTNGQRDYYTAWIDFWTLLQGEPRNLKILPNGDDVDEHYVIPDGYIDRYVHAYGVFADWCANNNVQLLVYGFDWRRSSQEAATYFLDTFLPKVDDAIRKTGRANALTNYSLVGHSLGGMAVKLVINDYANAYVQNMSWAITVASPFYGYGGQIRRYLWGIKEINWSLAGPSSQNQEMARIIATMPGGYEFVYLDQTTYAANKAAFAADPHFPLGNYPSLDPNGNPADPYNPPSPAYYPFFSADNFQMLVNAVAVAHDVAKPLDASVVPKFFNIRGIQKTNGNRLNNTVVANTWKAAPPGFDPDASHVDDPMTDIFGFGDGVQPAWGTRLLQMLGVPDRQPDGLSHVIDVEDDVDHVHMMNYTVVQNYIAQIIHLGGQQVFIEWLRPDTATAAQFNQFLLKMPQPRAKKPLPEEEVRRQIFAYLSEFRIKDLQRLAWRGFVDMMKSSPPPKPRRKKSQDARPKAKKPDRAKQREPQRRRAKRPARNARGQQRS